MKLKNEMCLMSIGFVTILTFAANLNTAVETMTPAPKQEVKQEVPKEKLCWEKYNYSTDTHNDQWKNICQPEQPTTSADNKTPEVKVAEGVEQWRGLVERYFPAEAVTTALQVMDYESSGNPQAHNGNSKTGDDSWGLYQINLYGRLKENRPSSEELQDGEKNIAFAAELYRNSGNSFRPHWANTMRKLGK